MRNAKLWSVLLAAVLVCACLVGVMTTGASASDTRVPTATTTYVVGTDGATIRACLDKAAAETWGKDDVLEIQFSGTDTSAYSAPDAANGISGYTLFETTTIFREDDTQLPIVIRGTDEDRAALIKTGSNSYNATNDYFFVNLTMNGGVSAKATVSFYAGSGELVFEDCKFNNYSYTYYYGDCQAADAFEGWDAAKVAANSNEDGLLETGIVLGNGCTGMYASWASDAPNEHQRFSAVGFNDSKYAPEIYALNRATDDVTAALTEDQVDAVKEAAKVATFRSGNIISADECIVKPWDTASYLVIDTGTKNPTDYEVGYCGARKGLSPVHVATVELISGGVQYLSADNHAKNTSEVFVGDTNVIVRGGKTLSNEVGIRLTNNAFLVGDLTLEIHEDDPTYPTQTKFVQAAQGSTTSTVYGDYYFLMTGGTIGNGYSIAQVDSNGDQVVSSGTKKYSYSDSNDGYWGAPLATGTIINDVRGGQIWQFYGSRYSNSYCNTPVSITLPVPGPDNVITTKVSVYNKISGGIIGGPKVNGDRTDSAGELIDIQVGTAKRFYGACKNSNCKLEAVCNEITGGTIYGFSSTGVTGGKTYAPKDLYNVVSGTEEVYPTFKCDFYGCSSSGGYNVTNVITGYPQFNDGTTKRWFFGGAKNGTVDVLKNYFGGLPGFKSIYGGSTGTSTAKGSNAAVTHLYNYYAFDDVATSPYSEIYAGNGYFQISGRDGATKTSSNSYNYISKTFETNIYSGTFGTFRSESVSGDDKVDAVLNIYGGTWTGSYMPVNRKQNRNTTVYADKTFTTNIYGGTFKGTAYMAGQNERHQNFVHNIYGGTFKGTYYGGGSVWVKSVVNNIYNATFEKNYCGGGNLCGSESIVNNIYGGSFSNEVDIMGAYGIPSDATFHNAGTIENNIYGGKLNEGWTYLGHRNGQVDTIENNIYSGKDNPVRDPENELYKYYNEATMNEAGVILRDQVLCGSGYNEEYVQYNTANSITNNFAGGLWLQSKGAGANITLHGGMRWGIVGNITNNFIEGDYYRVYGGSDYLYVTGTIENNFGSATVAEGEEAPELNFAYFVFGGGMDQSNGKYPSEKIAEAKAAETPTATQTSWINLAATYGENLRNGAKNIVNTINYGTFHTFCAGSYGSVDKSYRGYSDIESITTTVNGGTFNKYTSENTVFAGGCWRDATIEKGITNTINGGTFNGNYYGGSVGTGAVVCPSITNIINGGEGWAKENATIFLGNGSPTYNGVIISTINNFTANMSYVYAGSASIQNQPENAEYAIDTTINGGSFVGFWGQGGGTTSVLNGNIRTTVNGGNFYSYGEAAHMRNAIAGGSRNGSTTGNIELIINDGTFKGDVVGGVIWGSRDSSLKLIDGDVTTTIKGGAFTEDVYAVCREENAIDVKGTATLTVEQTAGKALSFGGEGIFDEFTSIGEEIQISANTDLEIKKLNGELNVTQTEGWLAHDYVIVPATAVVNLNEAEGIYGGYCIDTDVPEIKRIYGSPIFPNGATIRLSERLGIRIVLSLDEVNMYGDAFTYSVTMGETVLASGGKADLEIYQGNYSIVFDGIGLGDFETDITLTGSCFEDTKLSIVGLASEASVIWAEKYPTWAEYAGAILEFNSVYNHGTTCGKTPAAVETQPEAEMGAAGVADANVTLLMGDAAGLRLTAKVNGTVANAKLTINGEEVKATVTEETIPAAEEGGEATVVSTITADIYFAHEFLAESFVLSVESDAGVHMTYTASIEAIAAQLANDEANAMRNNATAFLYYIQKAVACK